VLDDRAHQLNRPISHHLLTLRIWYINKLERRKAAGIDDIANEHIMFGGPHLGVHLCLL